MQEVIYSWNPDRKVVINPDMKMSQFDLIAVPVANRTNNERKGEPSASQLCLSEVIVTQTVPIRYYWLRSTSNAIWGHSWSRCTRPALCWLCCRGSGNDSVHQITDKLLSFTKLQILDKQRGDRYGSPSLYRSQCSHWFICLSVEADRVTLGMPLMKITLKHFTTLSLYRPDYSADNDIPGSGAEERPAQSALVSHSSLDCRFSFAFKFVSI